MLLGNWRIDDRGKKKRVKNEFLNKGFVVTPSKCQMLAVFLFPL